MRGLSIWAAEAGRVTRYLADRLPSGNVIGTDCSRSMIDAAYPLKTNNLRFRLMDIDADDFHHAFDLTFSNAALHWLYNHERLLARCYNSLRENGAIRFAFAASGNSSTFQEVIRQVIASDKYGRFFEKDWHWPWFTPSADQYPGLAATGWI